jgi:hypothetical protein
MDAHAVTVVAKSLLAVIAAIAITQQCRKPFSWPGRLVARSMNDSHSRVTNWGLSHVQIESRSRFSTSGVVGYADVEIFEQPKKGWICAVGRTPA